MTIDEKIESLALPLFLDSREKYSNEENPNPRSYCVLSSKDVRMLLNKVALLSYNKGFEKGFATAAEGKQLGDHPPSLDDDLDMLEKCYIGKDA